jgi:hypothetical protein
MIERPSFAGHETFPLRYTWLKKGFEAVRNDPGVFLEPDALVRLGVGKNMVKSIRHWGLATEMLEEEPGTRGRQLKPTQLAEALFDDEKGWDRYLEDFATLWLLHWRLASRPGKATTWYWLFNHFPSPDFTCNAVVRSLLRLVVENGWPRLTETSLRRDVDCCIRTYNADRRTARAVLEDTLDCPLSDLGLVRNGPERDTYILTRENRPTLPVEIFTYALMEYLEGRSDGASAVSLDELMHHPGAPGRVFRMTEDELLQRAEELSDVTNGELGYDETAGLKQVRIRGELKPITMLRRYYAPRGRRPR